MSVNRWMVPAATGVAGLVAGWLLATRDEVRAAAPVIPKAALVQPGSNQVGERATLSLDDVRRVVREELAAQRGGAPAPIQAPDSPPTPEQQAAATQAEAVLAAAIARRSWTEADGDAMRESFQHLAPDQQAELMQSFSVAVNQGRLVPQTERIPF